MFTTLMYTSAWWRDFNRGLCHSMRFLQFSSQLYLNLHYWNNGIVGSSPMNLQSSALKCQLSAVSTSDYMGYAWKTLMVTMIGGSVNHGRYSRLAWLTYRFSIKPLKSRLFHILPVLSLWSKRVCSFLLNEGRWEGIGRTIVLISEYWGGRGLDGV